MCPKFSDRQCRAKNNSSVVSDEKKGKHICVRVIIFAQSILICWPNQTADPDQKQQMLHMFGVHSICHSSNSF